MFDISNEIKDLIAPSQGKEVSTVITFILGQKKNISFFFSFRLCTTHVFCLKSDPCNLKKEISTAVRTMFSSEKNQNCLRQRFQGNAVPAFQTMCFLSALITHDQMQCFVRF